MPQQGNDRILTDFLDRTLDLQKDSTQAVTSLDTNLKEVRKNIDQINGFFHNGFRDDIRELKRILTDHVSTADSLKIKLQDNADKIQALNDKLDTIIEKVTSKGFWIKLGIGAIASIATVTVMVYKIVSMLNDWHISAAEAVAKTAGG